MKLSVILAMSSALSAATITGSLQINTLRVADGETVSINGKVRYATIIVLKPDTEMIVGIGAGDAENWGVRPSLEAGNVIHLKPVVRGFDSNLHLRTKSGRTISFELHEISKCPKCKPDQKVFVEPIEPMPNMSLKPVDDRDERIIELAKRVSVAEAQARDAKAETVKAKRDAAEATVKEVAQFRATYPVSLSCDYDSKFNRAPFMMQAICSDDTHTFIKVDGDEMPSLYVERDGKPALVQFHFEKGTIVTENVIHAGYLQLGRKKLKFRQKG